MANALFTARAKFYFNTPEMMRRLGKWRNDLLAATGAFGQGVFRNKLSRPQLKQTKERTVQVITPLWNKHGHLYAFKEMLFVPRIGPVVIRRTNKPAPRRAAAMAYTIVSSRLKGQGAGKPPRMGPTKNMRRHNEFALDDRTETVVIGTKPLPKGAPIDAASVPNMLDEGLSGWVNNQTVGAAAVQYAKHPYVESVGPPTQRKLEQLIRRRQAGS